MIAALARFLSRRSARERLLFALLFLAALPLGFAALVALPLVDARADAHAGLTEARATRDWYRARQAEIAALPVTDSAEAAGGVTPIGLGGIERTLIEAGLRAAVGRLANAPSGGVTLSLQAVEFAPLMGWLEGVEAGAGYRVAALVLERSAPGLVDAEVRLAPRSGTP